ncbi:MAG TPA: hypothetical protein PK325_03605 [Cyclobacteriaceae bacterium]|nr:hypothetical protein [Cyclobacteriaceae bacterium]HMV07900.1 hypothetical protein [Cyclobacteriaceae bacterium]HMV88168.1 hypothetical protein [Cyclobacteriaceae bacterium]HMW99034.1 hypothetical protein [Cyclobacteriaceae bacterium]HMX48332.1 hypothetical protein [Cyclobacteriaceae bacterium]
MFGPLKALFKNNEPATKVIDKVWMSANARFNACIAMARANSACVFICWFPETYEKLQQSLPEEQLVLADRASAHTFEGRMIVFAEHHPLGRKEAALFKTLNLHEAPVLSSLDEPLFMRFGGDRTIEIMKKLGMKEDEVVGSDLITRALRNAQRKIEEKVVAEREARSQQEWFNLNFPPQ